MTEPEGLRRDLPFLNKLFCSIIPIILLRRYRLITVTLYLKQHPMQEATINGIHLKCHSFWSTAGPTPHAISFNREEQGTRGSSDQASLYTVLI